MAGGDERVGVDAWSLSYARVSAAGRGFSAGAVPAGLMIERGLEGCSQKGRGFAPHAAVTDPVIINGGVRPAGVPVGNGWLLAQRRCAPGAREGATWSTRSAASINAVDPTSSRRSSSGRLGAVAPGPRPAADSAVGVHHVQPLAPAGQFPG